jgi:putative SbcD/Mre11-related phosphoesterase
MMRAARRPVHNPVSLFPGPGGWQLAPEGAAVHLDERVAVIADVHLGYEWARGTAGDCVPAHSLRETLAKLDNLLARAAIERLIVAGDLVESPAPCRPTLEDLRALNGWLRERGVALTPLAGNHDPRSVPPLPSTCEVAGWTVAHGHLPITAPRTISGHIHPVLRAGGVMAPCFLVGPSTILLPAFTSNAAGLNVSSAPLPGLLRSQSLRCIVATESELLDFGPLKSLANRLATSAPPAHPASSTRRTEPARRHS